ncbi:outer membrane protein assembly factor BamE [Providencia vermicola]|uniref:Outer membrane protein assembly factor BamE n=1 Tax=Providencia stuartii TaxID=588 RepID=A0AAI9HY87_PROST|nr:MULTISPECIES: outer membrane protein assembly factor BamE [Providencia]ELR5035192.1 outer membrane protein assembly factor BamE [Providencia stuartii]ELR5121675.1 outer membrane protein assembly factor BamE [Providencia stuartii]ELR5141075.1 outer membrane protein assembly factor BamE [Providencia stuartii]ELR5290480.1 outer membrane protein assembly factor BamE [Providencia stuartii]ELZ5938450.1 outer membrane protein assembly factor BamE [Providencia stuartii]
MRYKLLTAAALSLALMSTGCSMMERLVYHPDINQGNYLTAKDVAKIQKGMTQQQVAYTLGTPMLTDPFGTQTWYYVFRQELGHDPVKQETLTLTFDRNGILTEIKNEKNLAEQEAMEAKEIESSPSEPASAEPAPATSPAEPSMPTTEQPAPAKKMLSQ